MFLHTCDKCGFSNGNKIGVCNKRLVRAKRLSHARPLRDRRQRPRKRPERGDSRDFEEIGPRYARSRKSVFRDERLTGTQCGAGSAPVSSRFTTRARLGERCSLTIRRKFRLDSFELLRDRAINSRESEQVKRTKCAKWSAAAFAAHSFEGRFQRVCKARPDSPDIDSRPFGDACVEALWAKMVGRNRRPCVSRLIRIIYPRCMVDSYRDRLRKVLRGYVELSVGR